MYKPDYERLQYSMHPVAYPILKLFGFVIKWVAIAYIFTVVFKYLG